MYTQEDLVTEDRTTNRRMELERALVFGLAEEVRYVGGTFVGLAITYEKDECRLVYKADFEGRRMVAFVYSDNMVNVILKAVRLGRKNHLQWKDDRYAAIES